MALAKHRLCSKLVWHKTSRKDQNLTSLRKKPFVPYYIELMEKEPINEFNIIKFHHYGN